MTSIKTFRVLKDLATASVFDFERLKSGPTIVPRLNAKEVFA
ncbi:MAG TPA: hypothetical protein VK615_16345 [Candidatus Binatia bacterium]|nr:hypothetical protein [Candidatus Binatia bacterium]